MAGQYFSYLIVLDFESTCWKDKKMNYAPEISKYQFFRQKKTYILKKIWCFHVMDPRKWIIFNCLRKKYIYVYVVWGSADQAQFWHLLCQTLKHAKKTVIFIVLNYFWFFFGCTVEFPAVLLNTNSGEIESEFHMYVQPQEHTKLSDFCKELTGITQVCSEKHHFLMLTEAFWFF